MIIFDARSKVLIDQHSSTTVISQEKTDITIDLTNDLLIDHHSSYPNKMTIDHPDHHDHLSHEHDHVLDDQQPLLRWSKEFGKFISHKQFADNDDPMNGSHTSTSSSSNEIQSITKDMNQHSLIDMFDNDSIDCSKKYQSSTNDKKNQKEKRLPKSKIDVEMEKLFDGYITFYQRVCLFYLRKERLILKFFSTFFIFEKYLIKLKQKDEQSQSSSSSQ